MRRVAVVASVVAVGSSSPALGAAPTIESFSPTFGPVGTSVTITGTDFRGTDFTTSAVELDGVAADFTVDSTTQITATVPAEATTGRISVTTPEGTATSLERFRVSTVHPRALSMALSERRVARGWVTATDDFKRCQAQVPIEVQRESRHGVWRVVGATTTSDEGFYRVRIDDRKGTYRVTAPRFVLSQGAHICRARTLGFTTGSA